MSLSDQLQKLSQPISDGNPCGENLEDTQLLASFDAYRLFGATTPPGNEIDWRKMRDESLDALDKSHDLRLLAHFAAASTRLEGWMGFLGSIGIAAGWSRANWDAMFPRIDEDAILRKNALSCFSDRMAILDGLRRASIVEHKQLGKVTLRDVEMAAGEVQPTAADTSPVSDSQITAVLAAAELPPLQGLATGLASALSDLAALESQMRDVGGTDSSPDFDPLKVVLTRVRKLVDSQLAARGVGAATAAGDATDAAAGGAVGAIKSRADAMRAMDAIATFFKQTEPSSPVPLFLERARRLVGKNFLEVLSDVAPDGMTTARAAGGIKDE